MHSRGSTTKETKSELAASPMPCGHMCIPVPQQPNLAPIPNYSIAPPLLFLKAPLKVAACQGLCGRPTTVTGLCGCAPQQCGCGHHFNDIVAAAERRQHFKLSKKHKAWIALSAPVETLAKARPMDRFVNVFSPVPTPEDTPILCPPPPPPSPSIPANLEMPSEAGPERMYKCRGTLLVRACGWLIANYPHLCYAERHLRRWRRDMECLEHVDKAKKQGGQ